MRIDDRPHETPAWITALGFIVQAIDVSCDAFVGRLKTSCTGDEYERGDWDASTLSSKSLSDYATFKSPSPKLGFWLFEDATTESSFVLENTQSEVGESNVDFYDRSRNDAVGNPRDAFERKHNEKDVRKKGIMEPPVPVSMNSHSQELIGAHRKNIESRPQANAVPVLEEEAKETVPRNSYNLQEMAHSWDIYASPAMADAYARHMDGENRNEPSDCSLFVNIDDTDVIAKGLARCHKIQRTYQEKKHPRMPEATGRRISFSAQDLRKDSDGFKLTEGQTKSSRSVGTEATEDCTTYSNHQSMTRSVSSSSHEEAIFVVADPVLKKRKNKRFGRVRSLFSRSSKRRSRKSVTFHDLKHCSTVMAI